MWTCQLPQLVVRPMRRDRPGEPQTLPGAEDVSR